VLAPGHPSATKTVANMHMFVPSREPEQQNSRTRDSQKYIHSISTKRPHRLHLATRRASHDSTLLYRLRAKGRGRARPVIFRSYQGAKLLQPTINMAENPVWHPKMAGCWPQATAPYCWNNLALSRPTRHDRFAEKTGIDRRRGLLRALLHFLCTWHPSAPIATPVNNYFRPSREAAARAPDAPGKPMQSRCLERRASMISRCETVSSSLCCGQGISSPIWMDPW
jgi:hypothetical protein